MKTTPIKGTPEKLRDHADVLLKIPSGELFIGHIQSVLAAALRDLAAWIDEEERRDLNR